MNAPKRTLTREDYERFLPLVRRIAMRLARRVPSHISIGDLISSGWVGLVEAFSRSGEDMPAEEFEAYASHRVRGAMLDYLRGLDPATRQARNASRRVSRTITELTRVLGRPPEEEEIADALGLDLDAYRSLLGQISSAGMSRLELVDLDQIDAVTDKSEAPDDIAEQRLLAEHVAGAIERLPLRLQQVLALYYQEDCTLREIGAVLQVSESRVCQLHAEAMHRLRAEIGKE
jgi:RNA polymerase sigma factor for flagellar operon FliA